MSAATQSGLPLGEIKVTNPIDGYFDWIVSWKIPESSLHSGSSINSSEFTDKFNSSWFVKFHHIEHITAQKFKVELFLVHQGTKSIDEAAAYLRLNGRRVLKVSGISDAVLSAFPGTRLGNTFTKFFEPALVPQGEAMGGRVTIHCGIKFDRSTDKDRLDFVNPISLDKRYADVTICAEGNCFPAHKVILAARSPVFQTMFNTEVGGEAKENRIVINDFPAKLVEGMLDFIYNDHSCLRLEFGSDWLRIADMYGLDRLKSEAAKSLADNVTLENALEFFDAGLLYNEPALRKTAVDFIKENSEAIIETRGMKDYAKANPDGMIELFAATHGIKRKFSSI